jgi:hypothetical protein
VYSLKQKKVISKVLYSFGWGSPTIARWLNISRGTVLKANKAPTPENMESFEYGLKEALLEMNYCLLFQINKKIMDLVPSESDINKLVNAGQYFSTIEL